MAAAQPDTTTHLVIALMLKAPNARYRITLPNFADVDLYCNHIWTLRDGPLTKMLFIVHMVVPSRAVETYTERVLTAMRSNMSQMQQRRMDNEDDLSEFLKSNLRSRYHSMYFVSELNYLDDHGQPMLFHNAVLRFNRHVTSRRRRWKAMGLERADCETRRELSLIAVNAVANAVSEDTVDSDEAEEYEAEEAEVEEVEAAEDSEAEDSEAEDSDITEDSEDELSGGETIADDDNGTRYRSDNLDVDVISLSSTDDPESMWSGGEMEEYEEYEEYDTVDDVADQISDIRQSVDQVQQQEQEDDDTEDHEDFVRDYCTTLDGLVVRCPVCLSAKQMCILECGHMICHKCVVQLTDTCALCRNVFTTHRYVAINSISTRKCETCQVPRTNILPCSHATCNCKIACYTCYGTTDVIRVFSVS